MAQEQAMGVLKDGDVSVSVTWEATEAWVLGRYRVTNAGKASLYLFDRLYQTAPSGARTVDADLAWRWLEADGVYRVAKFVPQVPVGWKVESPEVAYARALPVGGMLEGAVLLPGRLDQALPYGVAPPLAPVAKIKGIVLSFGFAEIDAAAEPVVLGKGEAQVLSLPFDWLITRQRMVSSEFAPLAVVMQP